MKAGPMHDRVQIDEPVPGVDGMIAPRHAWAPVWECAAQISTLTGREYFSQQRENAIEGTRIVIRFPPPTVNVTAACRCTDVTRGIVYAIEAVLFDDKRTLMTLACVAGANDG